MTKTRVVDGIEFTAAPFPAVEALRLKAYLARTVGPALAEGLGALRAAGGAGAEVDAAALSGALEKLTAALDEDGFVSLVRRMLQYVTAAGRDADGRPLVAKFDGQNFEDGFNRIFAGRLLSVYPVMLLVLEANYPDFFGMAARSIGGLTAQTGSSARDGADGTGAPPRSEA